MSQQLISHSPDLKRLRDEGFDISIISDHLIVSGIPFVNSRQQIEYGALVSELTLAGNITTKPGTHVVYFVGSHPCNKDGSEISPIKHESTRKIIAEGVTVDHSFSNKPSSGYPNYYEKMSRYIEMISAPVLSIDASLSAKSHRVIDLDEQDSVFHYIDSNSSRAGIGHIAGKLKSQKVGIVGVGGTGAYVLDLLSKNPVQEIHFYDDDQFLLHNAFRTPGAAALDVLRQAPKKVDYLLNIYSRMHKNVNAHPYNIDETNVNELLEMNFVFICVDKGPIKSIIIETLEKRGVSYIDVGMGVHIADNTLLGILRVTTGTPENKGQAREKKRINFAAGDEHDLYTNNIQIADLNALNAALAIIQWKKLSGYYQDLEKERHATYSINVGMLLNEDHAT